MQERILQDRPRNQTERQLVWPNSGNVKGEVGMRDSLRTTECMAKRGLKKFNLTSTWNAEED